MSSFEETAADHVEVTRRYFLGTGAAAVGGMQVAALVDDSNQKIPAQIKEALSEIEYLTPEEKFRNYGRGEPPPYKLSQERLRDVGLDRDTWELEVITDPDSDAQVEHVMSRELGTSFKWKDLMDLAEKHAVRFLSALTCTNDANPCGMGLWEGVPLREIVWLARPIKNVRRVFYYGYHNDDEKQRFQSSLSLNRVLEDSPGENPIILCYKLNDQWLTAKRGGPVRMLVSDGYGNKSVKWLQRIVLTNNYQNNDTYALWNNDTESPKKTYARFLLVPKNAKAGQPIPITGVAQVGIGGLTKVQYYLCAKSTEPSKDDQFFLKGDWKDAVILPPPEKWGGGLPDGKLPPVPLQIGSDGKPTQWPLRNTLVHWAAVIEGIAPGEYYLRCRTIDANGVAQPMPRPYLKSGKNEIHRVEFMVVESSEASG